MGVGFVHMQMCSQRSGNSVQELVLSFDHVRFRDGIKLSGLNVSSFTQGAIFPTLCALYFLRQQYTKIDIFQGLSDAENTPWDTDLEFLKKSIHLKVSLCLLPPCLLLQIHNAAPIARAPEVIPDWEANLGENPWYKEKELDLLMTLKLLCSPCFWTFLQAKETVSYLKQYYRDLLLRVNKPIPAYKPLLYRN